MNGNGNEFIERFGDMIRLIIYALIWGVLATLQLKIGRGFVSYIFVAITPFLALAWAWRVYPRLRDAGLPRWYVFPLLGAPLVLLVSLVQLKVIGGTVAFVLFVLTQIPIIFIRRKAGGPAISRNEPH